MRLWAYTRFAALTCISLAGAAASVPPLEIFQKNCVQCHSEKLHTSGFSVASLESVIQGGNKHGRGVVAGHPETSPVIKLLKGELAPRMPMGGQLSDADIAALEDWVRTLPPAKQGAASTAWRWPYEKPVRKDPPNASNAGWVRNPIDNFILAKLDSAGLKPAPPAAKRTLS